MKKILITGNQGFIGKNLTLKILELGNFQILEFNRQHKIELLAELINQSDYIIHLAGENRPENPEDFAKVNTDLTEAICMAIKDAGRHIPIILASSTQVELDNYYGRSKRAAEDAVEKLAEDTNNPSMIYRLPGVFGKWCKPNYNSVVATFCHNIANELPINIHNASTKIDLVYIDDVVDEFIKRVEKPRPGLVHANVRPQYAITLGELADQLRAFNNCRTSLIIERVGDGLIRALYSTYISYLPTEKYVYDLPMHADERGLFVEMLKTHDSGQFSYFTAKPGITRGGHYHHSKTEKFLVIKGKARFCFRNIISNERYELHVSGNNPQVVETIPGWIHDITNIGDEELIVMLWANEVFDRDRPDTVAGKV